MKRVFLDFVIVVWGIFTSLYVAIISSPNALAFNKLKNGFETITTTYLIPLSAAVAGASFILYVILSYFKQEEYQKKVGNVLALTVFSATGLEIINNIIQSFS
ncbi:MAG: hypothetical protein COW00_00080 [Bdellovibrio sp. CG12_big_fil_rev_8_21_14_0_65_39_13]|nr:MAG: hypothetical protein COW78_20015 [Bdellovibrio sp. CG22_combo_CG10-13_8_21_14_all_39_27]PIQ62880.1 MAG: hypothetical protein COW00_00080 [Bdellovibrio sp. CG12_big_fil_rev_8_21_14_0_65_39_13]PIR33235.1 MAG: hypothetical protein COV37_16815 [Bdellovibrio sp. CG11_big_fil_rev_8_21_14_0_20_39_38]PJB54015.1 MAG: hypothetical protein CO099_03955 [Bdellovibrio sp. CG_4_9_14_3_um_filter_39_7]